jgi:alpha-glucosidase
MPWAATAPNAGFTPARPWLPLGSDHAPLAVDAQESAPGSLLTLTRRLIALRKAHPALVEGAMTVLHTDAALLVFARTLGDQRLVCAFNLSPDPLALPPALLEGLAVVEALNGASLRHLPGYAALVAG